MLNSCGISLFSVLLLKICEKTNLWARKEDTGKSSIAVISILQVEPIVSTFTQVLIACKNTVKVNMNHIHM